jgi:2-polyprenyl-3-methyl-5-hydroxy-6-metoxy-1,4-benzoquinol methylase
MAERATASDGGPRVERCPACEAAGSRMPMLLKGRYQLYRCRRCRSQFFRAVSWESEKSEYWSEEYKFDVYSSPEVRADLDRRYRQVFDRVERMIGPVDSVLDIGCGVGNFLALAESQGWRAVGFDVEPRAVARARASGHEVYHDPLEYQHKVEDESFDAGTMWDVIEHLADPRPVLEGLARKVRPGGVLVLETPDARFPVRPVVRWLRQASGGRIKLSGRMYYWEHKIYFTATGLSLLLESVGCEVLDVTRENSPRTKMAKLWEHSAASGNVAGRLMVKAWPTLDRLTRGLGLGNKLVMIARRRVPGGGSVSRG